VPKTRRDPVRTCVACRDEGGKTGLVRFVRDADGKIVEDPTGRGVGGGASPPHDPACRELALKRRSLERALKQRSPA
jgi:uncharacterized protein